ncbi:MAG TPA: hypothetical protein PKI03_21195 [Pseudomonadota bacterium]|nr:hypothetical protein [Pseudomonadota bacterium]
MAEIIGIEGMSDIEIKHEIEKGGRFVIFEYTISILIMTFKRPTGVYFIRAGESAAMKALPWTLLTLVLGWWGIPWGFIYTPMALFTNLSGGKDVTQHMLPGG